MWLNLDLYGIDFIFGIYGYQPTKNISPGKWCKVDLILQSDKWLSYRSLGEEMLMSFEVEMLVEQIDALLNDKLKDIWEYECTEPDLMFSLQPKRDLRRDLSYKYVAPGHEIKDIFMDFSLVFWNGTVTKNRLTLTFFRKQLIALNNYLKLVTKQLNHDDTEIIEMIKTGILITKL